ncbi:MAG: helix-turn-helix transcriptional regulator [Fimbriimonadaceae bacterium]
MKRLPTFRLTPGQVIARCREQKHCDMCAGHVLALMALMVHRKWTISELADHSHVRRSTLSEILILKKCPCTDTRHKLAECFGMPLCGFELLAHFSFVEANSP